MSTIEELLVSYKNVNDQLAKNNELNEKIFKEMTFSKIKKSFFWLYFMDAMNIVIFPLGTILLGYFTYKCSDNTIMLIISIITFISIIASYYSYLKPLRFRFFISNLINEQSVNGSISNINVYLSGLKKARLWSFLAASPYYVFILPVSWYALYGTTFEGVYDWHLKNGTLLGFTAYVLTVYVVVFYLVWKSFDWLYFPKLKKAIENLEELN